MGGEEIKTEIWLESDKTSIAAIRAKLALTNNIAPASRVLLVTLSGGLCPDDDDEAGEGRGRGRGGSDSDSENDNTGHKQLREDDSEMASSRMNSQPVSLLITEGAVEHKRAAVFGWRDIRLRIHVRYDNFDGLGTPLTVRTRFLSSSPAALLTTAIAQASHYNSNSTARSSISPLTSAGHSPNPTVTVNSASKRDLASAVQEKERGGGRSRSTSGERKSDAYYATWTESPGFSAYDTSTRADAGPGAGAGGYGRAGSGKGSGWSPYGAHEGELEAEEHEDIWTDCPSPVPSPPVRCEDDSLGTEDHQAFQSIYASRYGTIEEESLEVAPTLTRRKPKPIVHW